MEKKFHCNSCQTMKPIEEKVLLYRNRYACISCRDKIKEAKKKIALSRA